MGEARKDKAKVAFICVHNSCRSQMAEAFCKTLANDTFEAYSAGTVKVEQINQDAVRIMKQEYEIEMGQEYYSKLLDEIPKADIVVTMGCNVSCPTYFYGKYRVAWSIDDPTGKDDETFKQTAKMIRENVLLLVEDYGNNR